MTSPVSFRTLKPPNRSAGAAFAANKATKRRVMDGSMGDLLPRRVAAYWRPRGAGTHGNGSIGVAGHGLREEQQFVRPHRTRRLRTRWGSTDTGLLSSHGRRTVSDGNRSGTHRRDACRPDKLQN